ncbi:TA system VapC family ribonuclease toxin [Gryllotalpicola koreensis]|uniref:Ribonuclease VapC n=1 Tax=Gryllotalpicola koreensis TaxID=993086 RepID=A0ABP7ZU32_9MICO
MSLELPDVNVLFALAFVEHEHHARAENWWVNSTRYATTPITESGLVRMALNPRVSGQPLTWADAAAVLESVRNRSGAEFLEDDATLVQPRVDPKLIRGHRQVTDFHLLGLAVRHDAVLVTFDRGIEEAFGKQHGDSIRVL